MCPEQADGAGELWVQYVSIFVSDHQIKIQVPCIKNRWELTSTQTHQDSVHLSERKQHIFISKHVPLSPYFLPKFYLIFITSAPLFSFCYAGKPEKTTRCLHILSAAFHQLITTCFWGKIHFSTWPKVQNFITGAEKSFTIFISNWFSRPTADSARAVISWWNTVQFAEAKSHQFLLKLSDDLSFSIDWHCWPLPTRLVFPHRFGDKGI